MCNVCPHLCFLSSCKVLSVSSWLTQLWANCCHPQQLCLSIIQSEDKSWLKRPLQVCFACTSLPSLYAKYYLQVSTEGRVNIIWIILPAFMCVMQSPQQHSSLSPVHQSRASRDLGQHDPLETQKGMRRLFWLWTSCIWDTFCCEKSSGFFHLHLWGQMGQQWS